MSFEGYYQTLRRNGHSNHRPYNCGERPWPEDVPCKVCGDEIVWTSLVDITNGDDGDTGYVKLIMKTEAVPCTCKCGHKHNSEESTYHIPPKKKGERCWRRSS